MSKRNKVQTPVFSESAMGDYQGQCGERRTRPKQERLTRSSMPFDFPPAALKLREVQTPFLFPRAWQLYFHFPPCFQLQPTSSYLHILTERGVGPKKDLALLVGAVVHPRQLVREPHGILAPGVCHQQTGAHLGPGEGRKERCP